MSHTKDTPQVSKFLTPQGHNCLVDSKGLFMEVEEPGKVRYPTYL